MSACFRSSHNKAQFTVFKQQHVVRLLLRQGELFDVVFSYSSVEHNGLGRYGDPLAPFGDVEAVAQMWCLVRPGGLLFLGLPSYHTQSQRRRACHIVWNVHRVYGYSRLQHVTANWEVLEEVNIGDRVPHMFYVLRRLDVV